MRKKLLISLAFATLFFLTYILINITIGNDKFKIIKDFSPTILIGNIMLRIFFSPKVKIKKSLKISF